ncbi:MAG: DUF3251 domain-containing protein [Candidatus Omnitrophica bacterium]|nr:DUF3251 domain-containing protein [Candidatus Omnitrophota bacterium]
MKLADHFLSRLALTAYFFLICSGAYAQNNVENRVQALEEYVETFQPTLVKFSEELQNNIQDYTKQLEQNLENFSAGLQTQVNTQIKELKRGVIVLDPSTPAFQSVDTNGGQFLVSIDRVEQMPSGSFRLYLNIGNLNNADYKGFKINIVWGKKFYAGYTQKIEEWRDTLKGAEYTFDGTLTRGAWNQAQLDIQVPDSSDLGYIEFEMVVLSVELQSAVTQ